MTTHPKGKAGWRERDDANAAARMRRRKLCGRKDDYAHEGAALSMDPHRLPEACPPAIVTQRQRDAVMVGLFCGDVPPKSAIAAINGWSEANRELDCVHYESCIDDAARAQCERLLDPRWTWRCGRGCKWRTA